MSGRWPGGLAAEQVRRIYVTELTREELLVENKRLLGALQRLGEAYQIREQNFADYVLATKDTRASAGRYRQIGRAHV